MLKKNLEQPEQPELIAIKSIAGEFAAQENHAAALTIYEVLITEVIKHFNDYRDEYGAFSLSPVGRFRKAIFAVYRFDVDRQWRIRSDRRPYTPKEERTAAGL